MFLIFYYAVQGKDQRFNESCFIYSNLKTEVRIFSRNHQCLLRNGILLRHNFRCAPKAAFFIIQFPPLFSLSFNGETIKSGVGRKVPNNNSVSADSHVTGGVQHCISPRDAASVAAGASGVFLKQLQPSPLRIDATGVLKIARRVLHTAYSRKLGYPVTLTPRYGDSPSACKFPRFI